jgi:hypothetical protein
MKITNHKIQITNKFQLPKFKIPNDHIIFKKEENSKYGLGIETGDPPKGWGVRRTNIGI